MFDKKLALHAVGLCVATLSACGGDVFGFGSNALTEEDSLVLRQVYGGGGNSSATYRDDFIELFNAGSTTLSLSGLSVQYLSAAGTGGFGNSETLRTELPSVTLAPGQSFLIQEARGTGGTTDLPSVDLVDPTPIAMSGTAGRVVLVTDTTPLACNGTSDPCSEAELARIVDLVGWGNAVWFEGTSAAPSTSNTTSIHRAGNGCTDTDQNSADFTTTSPTPRSKSSALSPCGSDDAGMAEDASTADAGSTEDASAQDAGEDASTPDGGVDVRIHDIQGSAHLSPMVGMIATGVTGIVTDVTSSGFYMQDPLPDANDATSEAVLVYLGSTPSVEVGDSVRVSGTVTEFRPGCNGCAASTSAYDNLTTTELTSPTVQELSHGNALPPAVEVGAAGRMPPLTHVDQSTSGSVEVAAQTTFDPAIDGIDFHESLEGMRVSLASPHVVGPTRDFGTSKEVVVSVLSARSRITARGGLRLDTSAATPDFQPERLVVSSSLGAQVPDLDVGDAFDGVIVGVVDYAFGKFVIMPRTLPAVIDGNLPRESVTLPVTAATHLDVATFNVENLGGDDTAARFSDTATIIVEGLGAPDIVVIEEIQDDNGATNNSVVSASLTAARLVTAVLAAGGPAYVYRDIAPSDDADGGEPGGNIRVGFLYRTDRGLAFVDRAGGNATNDTNVIDDGGEPRLEHSPGRIEPTSSAFSNSRKPLIGEFTFAGERVFVIGCHFNSKGGDDPTFGRFQPPVRSSEIQRNAQAAIVAGFVHDILEIDPNANVIVAGDLNDFRESSVVTTVLGAGMTDLVDTLPDDERYGYVFQGASQLLDHVLSSQALVAGLVGFDIVHRNAEFAVQQSDHDPSIARFAFASFPGDGGVPNDAGEPPMDASVEVDATVPEDASTPEDAATSQDASTLEDATTVVDSGVTEMDAAIAMDASDYGDANVPDDGAAADDATIADDAAVSDAAVNDAGPDPMNTPDAGTIVDAGTQDAEADASDAEVFDAGADAGDDDSGGSCNASPNGSPSSSAWFSVLAIGLAWRIGRRRLRSVRACRQRTTS